MFDFSAGPLGYIVCVRVCVQRVTCKHDNSHTKYNILLYCVYNVLWCKILYASNNNNNNNIVTRACTARTPNGHCTHTVYSTTYTCMRVDTVAGCKYLPRVFDTWRVRNLISRTLGLGNYMQNGKLPVGQSGPMPRIHVWYDSLGKLR
jgi:hypothetical protein